MDFFHDAKCFNVMFAECGTAPHQTRRGFPPIGAHQQECAPPHPSTPPHAGEGFRYYSIVSKIMFIGHNQNTLQNLYICDNLILTKT